MREKYSSILAFVEIATAIGKHNQIIYECAYRHPMEISKNVPAG